MRDYPEPNTLPSQEQAIALRDQALAQFSWARAYTMELIDSVPEELWFVKPGGLHTHLAWQIGHLAVAEYGLLLFRIRGRQPEDLELMPGWLRKQFGKGTEPSDDKTKMPGVQELLDRLSAIHEAGIRQASEAKGELLLEPEGMPYAVYPCKLGAIMFAPIHEAIHAGQIGMLRRAHGLAPLR